jgi:hypothetical protein
MSRPFDRLALAVVLISVARPALGNQGMEGLEITLPADGAVVNPGQTLIVTVASPDRSTFSKVLVIAEGGIGMSDAGSSLPARVSLTIPAAIDCRKYSLSAVGFTTGGLEVSTTIEIDVERPDMPKSIFVPMRQIIFTAEGDSGSIDLLARFSDGSVLRVPESSNVAYASSDPDVATVDPWVEHDPDYDILRDAPRFKKLLARIK